MGRKEAVGKDHGQRNGTEGGPLWHLDLMAYLSGLVTAGPLQETLRCNFFNAFCIFIFLLENIGHLLEKWVTYWSAPHRIVYGVTGWVEDV